MALNAKDLFGDTDDIDGFSDDERFAFFEKNTSVYEGQLVRNFNDKNLIRKDNWKSNNSNVTTGNVKNEKIIKEIYSGIRLINPLVSSSELENMMQGRKMIKLSVLKSYVNKLSNDIDCDWVTIGVIINKLTKVSKNGKEYSIWNLSDLSSDNVVSLFLFGKNHDKHWKLPIGSVIGLLNASFMDNNKDEDKKKKGNGMGPITIDDPDKLLHIGSSKDLGYCKAIKKNGDICGTMITKAEDEFCLYHIKFAYRKFSSKRPEIQTNFSNKEPEQYHFANNYVPNVSLSQNEIVLKTNAISSIQLSCKKDTEVKKLKKVLENPISRSARNLAALAKSTTNNFEPPDCNEKEVPLYADDFFKKIKDFQPKPADKAPILARGFKRGQTIDLPITAKDNLMSANKRRAIEVFKNKASPAVTSSTSSAPVTNSSLKSRKLQMILKKVNANLNESDEESKKKAQEAENEKKQLIDQALKRSSINGKVAELVENVAQDKHFKLLEKKERYENRLAEIKELDVKVVTCGTCKYTASSQSDYCKQESHKVQFHQAKKRFFECKNCHFRRFTYDSVFPVNIECQHCGNGSYEKASMIKLKTEKKLGKELLVRGEEIKFLNSVK